MKIKKLLAEKTVLFLGAGASKPYGLPLGVELKTYINSALPQLIDVLIDNGYDEKFIYNFNRALKFTIHPTIDIFLENKTQYREIGAICIANSILSMEKEALLFPQKDWYGILYNEFRFGSGTVNLENLTILTLNYDRSFEHFFYNNIDFNCPQFLEMTARDESKKIKIIHVHGMIGEYPQLTYGEELKNFDTLKLISANIKIVSDKIEDSPAFIQAKGILQKATNIIFLGFGYDKQTLQKFFKGMSLKGKKIIGTNFGVNQTVDKFLTNFFGQSILIKKPTLRPQYDCLKFFKNIDSW